jgi:4-hydroxy-tetrahydrodipicolinate reductase
MGVRLIHIIQETPSIKLYRATERPDHPFLGRDAGEVAGVGSIGVPIIPFSEDALDDSDSIVDFTRAEATIELVGSAKRKKIPMVIGSTA